MIEPFTQRILTMRRTASEVIRELEMRVAQLEGTPVSKRTRVTNKRTKARVQVVTVTPGQIEVMIDKDDIHLVEDSRKYGGDGWEELKNYGSFRTTFKSKAATKSACEMLIVLLRGGFPVGEVTFTFSEKSLPIINYLSGGALFMGDSLDYRDVHLLHVGVKP